MTVTLFALDGTRWESSRVLAAMADWQSGSPAARFSAVLPGADWPEELVTVRWQDDRGLPSLRDTWTPPTGCWMPMAPGWS